MYEKILVPMDGSKLAEQVFPCAAELARAFKPEVTLIAICEPDEKEYREVCHLYVVNMAAAFRKRIGDTAVQIKTSVFYGKAASEIIKYAEQNAVNLIVMTSHGRSGIVPWSLGSTVHKVLQRVGIPLLIVRAQEQFDDTAPVNLFGKIVVPLDGSENSAVVLPYVAEIARKLGSEIYLLQVVEHGKHVHTIGGLDYVLYKDHDMNERKSKAAGYLDKLASEMTGIRAVNSVVLAGDAAREVIKFADEKKCGLIAVSSHGDSAITAWVHGSVTYKILYASRQSIFFVPSPGIKRR